MPAWRASKTLLPEYVVKRFTVCRFRPHRVFLRLMFAAWLNGASLLLTVAAVVLLVFVFICLLISWHSHRLQRLERESLRRHVRNLSNVGCGF
jgi:hypothetical protein